MICFVYLQKFCKCIDYTFLVPNESHENRCRGYEKRWSKVVQKKRFICISKGNLFLLFFFQLQFVWTESLPVTLWCWKFYVPIYLGASDFGAHSIPVNMFILSCLLQMKRSEYDTLDNTHFVYRSAEVSVKH